METLYNNQFCYPASLYLTIALIQKVEKAISARLQETLRETQQDLSQSESAAAVCN